MLFRSVIGGASQWFSYQAESDGTLVISTEGSNFDTVLAVYTGPGTDFESLQAVACDNDGGPNGKTSVVRFAAVSGTVYYIAVDGVKAATGNVRLSYNLEVPFRFTVGQVGASGGQFRRHEVECCWVGTYQTRRVRDRRTTNGFGRRIFGFTCRSPRTVLGRRGRQSGGGMDSYASRNAERKRRAASIA